MIRRIISLLCGCLIMGSLTVPALAVDNYRFETVNPEEFYQVEPVYTSESGTTVITPEPDAGYGLDSQRPTNAPGSASSSVQPDNATGSAAASSSTVTLYPDLTGNFTEQAANQYALTAVAEVRKSDGSIGALKIPAIGLTVTAYDGELTAAMKKGVGHISSTSAWNGNIGICGHNRGVTLHFGKLKNLKPGDEIVFTTTLGTRTYVVTTVQKIASNDWSYLQYTADNRITLLTCVEDQPEYRLCVQAVEKR